MYDTTTYASRNTTLDSMIAEGESMLLDSDDLEFLGPYECTGPFLQAEYVLARYLNQRARERGQGRFVVFPLKSELSQRKKSHINTIQAFETVPSMVYVPHTWSLNDKQTWDALGELDKLGYANGYLEGPPDFMPVVPIRIVWHPRGREKDWDPYYVLGKSDPSIAIIFYVCKPPYRLMFMRTQEARSNMRLKGDFYRGRKYSTPSFATWQAAGGQDTDTMVLAKHDDPTQATGGEKTFISSSSLDNWGALAEALFETCDPLPADGLMLAGDIRRAIASLPKTDEGSSFALGSTDASVINVNVLQG